MSKPLLWLVTPLLLISCASRSPSATTTVSDATSVPVAPQTVTIRVPDPTAACAVWKPVLWSTQDTDDTIRQVKADNAAWKALCQAQ